LPRIAATNRSVFRSGDGEFEVNIFDSAPRRRIGTQRFVTLSRILPDPTPVNVFDDYRFIRNTFGVLYGFDATRAETSVDIPLLRTALLNYLDTSLQGRIIGGEK